MPVMKRKISMKNSSPEVIISILELTLCQPLFCNLSNIRSPASSNLASILLASTFRTIGEIIPEEIMNKIRVRIPKEDSIIFWMLIAANTRNKVANPEELSIS